MPDETRSHVEFWIPSDRSLDIHALKVPVVNLRPLTSIPLFGWARPGETKVWIDLKNAFTKKGKIPDPPEIQRNLWPPSGMDDLKPAFEWAIYAFRTGIIRSLEILLRRMERWPGDTAQAIAILKESATGVAKALLARASQVERGPSGRSPGLSFHRRRWLQLHPQVVVERDKTLRKPGS